MESKEVSRNSEEPNDKEKSMEGGTSDNSAEVSEEEEDGKSFRQICDLSAYMFRL